MKEKDRTLLCTYTNALAQHTIDRYVRWCMCTVFFQHLCGCYNHYCANNISRSFILFIIYFLFFFNLFLFCVIFFTSSSSSWILNNYKWTSSTLRGTSFSKYSNYIFKRKQYMHCHRICCWLLSIYNANW